MKTLTKEEVKQVAIELLNAAEEGSVLEIKMILRSRGFYATQSEVSAFMQELANEGEFKYHFNGTYRIYMLIPIGSIQNGTPITGDVFYETRKGIKIHARSSTDVGAGDFKVFSDNPKVADVLYFRGSWSRSQVRLAFSKITNSPYIDTRIKTLK
jgi:hypothetical protein